MQIGDQDSTLPPAPSDEPIETIKKDDLPYSETRYGSYYQEADEVCPRCSCEGYRPARDMNGHDLRQCLSCDLLYLPFKELCPRCQRNGYRIARDLNGNEVLCPLCQGNGYRIVRDTSGREERECAICGIHYLPSESDVSGKQ